MNKIFLLIFCLFLIFSCSSDDKQVVNVIQFPDFMSEVKTDTLYPVLDSLYIHKMNNNSYLISKMFLRYDENYKTSMLLYFRSDSLNQLVESAENQLMLRNVGQKDSAFVPFRLNFSYSNQLIDIEEIDDEDFQNYFNSNPFFQYDVTDSIGDTLMINNIPVQKDMILEGTDDSGDVFYELCLNLTADQSLSGQSYRFATRYFYLIEGASYSAYTPRFVFDKIEDSDTTEIILYCDDNKTLFHYYNTKSPYFIPAVLNRYFYLYFDLAQNTEFDEYTMINRALLSIPYDKENSESADFVVGLYAVTDENWKTSDSTFKSLIDNNSSYYNSDFIDFKMNNYVQNHLLTPDSVKNYGFLLKYYSASVNTGNIELPFNDLNQTDSSLLPKLIINYSVPIENAE